MIARQPHRPPENRSRSGKNLSSEASERRLNFDDDVDDAVACEVEVDEFTAISTGGASDESAAPDAPSPSAQRTDRDRVLMAELAYDLDLADLAEELQADAKRSLRVNVGPTERWITGILGGGLVGLGAWKRGWVGALAGVAGAGLIARAVTGRCPGYRVLGINTARRDAASPEDYFDRGIHVMRSVTIMAPRERLWEFWRDFENLPRIMTHLKSVSVLDERRSHWVATGPLNSSIEWDAEIINEQPPELLAWRSTIGSEVDNAGSVRFLEMPNGRGTQVKVTLEYIPRGGKAGKLLAKLFGEEPSQQIAEDLRRFKQITETGEIATTQGQPRGSCA